MDSSATITTTPTTAPHSFGGVLSKRASLPTIKALMRVLPKGRAYAGARAIRLDFDPDRTVTFSAASLDLQASLTVDNPLGYKARYHVTLDADALLAVVKGAPEDAVTIESDLDAVTVTSGAMRSRVPKVESELDHTHPQSAPLVTIGSADLVRVLNRTRYAAAAADYQAVFRAVRLHTRDGKLAAVATDGFRLARVKTDVTADVDALVPANMLPAVVGVLPKDELVTIYSGPNGITLAWESGHVWVATMEGSFPDYERVIPSDFPIGFTTEPGELAASLTRLLPMTDKHTNQRIDVTIKHGTLSLSTGSATESLSVQQEGTDEEMGAAYNASYLLDAIKGCSGRVRVRLSGPTTPSVILDESDPTYLALVVPLRTK